MTIVRYIFRSLAYYWRAHLGVFLGALLAAAILTGSLSVGDSVRYSLRRLALERLGKITAAILPGELIFREQLATQIAKETNTDVAPALLLRGTVALPDGSARANNVQIVGVDERFWKLNGNRDFLAGAGNDAFVANDQLAARLGLKPGDPVIVRVEEPSFLSRDAPLSGEADASVAIRLRLKSVAGPDQFGRFGLQANQVPPLTVFLPLKELQKQINRLGRANFLLVERIDAEAANEVLRRVWDLSDLNLEVRGLPFVAQSEPSELSGGDHCELRTDRVFLEPAIAARALKVFPDVHFPLMKARGVLTYLVNEIRLGEHTTPYSMVTAVEKMDLADDEIAINAWLADDLGAKVGDELRLKYYVVGENRQLAEKSSSFKVCKIFRMNDVDGTWMPHFPGLSDVDNCRDWHPGIPLDMGRIRPKDEEYWKQYRGTPKAFINLSAGQAIWANRFGNLTAIRYQQKASAVEGALRFAIDPTKAGLAFHPIRSAAMQASEGAQDFGQLFVGFSFFLVIAALLLMAMLFVFNLEQRTTEAGLLLSLGFDARRARRLFLWEGGALAIIGALCGAAMGALYAKLALHGLSTVWRDAVNLSEFQYHAQWETLLIGAGSSIGVGLLATWLAGRGQARRPAAELLASGAELQPVSKPGGYWSFWAGIFGIVAAGAVLSLGGRSAGAFFGAGALLLISGILLSHFLLGRLAGMNKTAHGLMGIGIRGAARRRARSLTTIAVLAAGIFMVISVGAFRENPLAHADERCSGTGGFALMGQTTMPIYESVENAVAMRLRNGDDASCLNLNRAQQPSFLGVHPQQLSARKAFTFIDGKDGWEALEQQQSDGAVPAIGDEATIRWGLQKALGDAIIARDDSGCVFKVRIVGVIANSILQGNLLISDRHFVQRFPSASGNRVFLIDAPTGKAHEVSEQWMNSLGDRGLELVPAWQRLADFQAVENSYIGIFEALGGLGLLLGSAGLGVVVMRNVMERRGELGLLLALGFQPRTVRWLVVCEHWFLVFLGVGIGGIAAAVAILPSVLSPGVHLSPVGPAGTIVILSVLCAAWSWLAAKIAMRGPLLDALRNE